MEYSMLQIKKEIHTLLKNYCEEHGLKLGGYVETLIKKNIVVAKPPTSILKADKVVKHQSY